MDFQQKVYVVIFGTELNHSASPVLSDPGQHRLKVFAHFSINDLSSVLGYKDNV